MRLRHKSFNPSQVRFKQAGKLDLEVLKFCFNPSQVRFKHLLA
ncbi:MAG: hypothetical protein NZ923_10685 [Candidatus Kryptonium sp.]|nr:hypothetical protein [Candidatus Kryptonium sp.]